MYCEKKKSVRKILFLTGIIMAFVIILVVCRGMHNKSYKNEAIERGESIYLNGKENCDEYIFLGDYISDTPYVRETLDYLYEFMKNLSVRK